MAARITVLVAVLAVLIAAASASYIVSRNVQKASLKAGTLKGKPYGLVTYKDKKGTHNVLFNNAINARPYSASVKQTAFRIDRKGGWGFWKDAKAYTKLKNVCKPNASLSRKLPDVVAACTMPDGSHWALQKWQRLNKNMGLRSKPPAATELHVSHFTDAYIPVLWMKWGWSKVSDGAYDHLYGAFSVNGWPAYGGKSTKTGVPLDTYGRNIYVDLVNPSWTKAGAYTRKGGWITWNSFLAHKPNGAFCATVWKKLFGVQYPNPFGATKFRATVEGPGVLPVVRWQGPPPGSYVPGLKNGNYLLGPTSTPPVSAPRQPFSEAAALPLNQEQRAVVGPNDSCYKIWGKY